MTGNAPTRVFGPALLTNTAATKYTVPAADGFLMRFVHFDNEDTVAHTVTVSIGTDAVGTEIFTAFSIAANSTYDWYPYLPMVAAEFVQAFADTTNKVTMTISGDLWIAA